MSRNNSKAPPPVEPTASPAPIEPREGSPEALALEARHLRTGTFWRSIALIQIPITLTAVLFAVTYWMTREIMLVIPEKPLPGSHPAEELPDTEFVDVATDYLNLTANYSQANAREQFIYVREMIREPFFSQFEKEMMGTELQAIEGTARSQMFHTDPNRAFVERQGNVVRVSMIGERIKMVGGRELPTAITRYVLTMTTVPRAALNQYGIVVTDVAFENEMEPGKPGAIDEKTKKKAAKTATS